MRNRREERAEQYESKAYKALQHRLAARVRRLRDKHAWTQEQAAHQSGLSVRLLQRVESEDVNLTFTTLARLVEGFGVDVIDLLAPLERKPK